MLIFSCDPDEPEKKKQSNTQDQDKDDKNPTDPTTKPADKPENPTKPVTPPNPAAPVASLGAISSQTAGNDGGEDARTKADTSGTSLGWVLQGKEITFSTIAKDKDDNEIPNAQLTWQWRKRGKDWKELSSTAKTVTIPIKADEHRVGAYELKVSATSGKKPVKSAKFTVRKSGCLPPSTTNRPADIDELKKMVSGASALADKDIPTIDTSLVTSMYELFISNTGFDIAINCWDVSNVTNMQSAFESLSMFNQNIGDWDVSKVTNMALMFLGASAFNNGGNASIGNWDTSKVTSMVAMFNGALVFSQDLRDWEVGQVTASGGFARKTPAWNRAHMPNSNWNKTP